MTNKNVIEIIDRLIKCGSAGTYSATPSEIFTAIVHGYYYIRPGKNTYKFLNKISKLLDSSWKDKSKICLETTEGCLSEVQLMGKLSGEALYIARSMFDAEYYASQDAWKQRYYDWGWTDEQIDRAFFEFPELKTVGITYHSWAGGTNFVGFADLFKDKTFAQVRAENEPKYTKKSMEYYEVLKNL